MQDDQWPEDWHNSPQVAIAGGIAAVVLLCLLIYAVAEVSDSSVEPPSAPRYPTSSSATTSTTLKTDTSTTSYSRTSVQTSEPAVAPPAPPPPADTPSDEPTTTDEDFPRTETGRAGSI